MRTAGETNWLDAEIDAHTARIAAIDRAVTAIEAVVGIFDPIEGHRLEFALQGLRKRRAAELTSLEARETELRRLQTDAA